jgi:hypothetical protein
MDIDSSETAEGLAEAMQAAIASCDDVIIGREIARQQPKKIELLHESRIKALKAVPDTAAGTSGKIQKKRGR